MNRSIAIGDVVRILNRTYGLAPARLADEPSPVVEIINAYDGTVLTESGRVASTADYEIVRRAEAAK